MKQTSPAVLGPAEPSVSPTTMAAFLEALNGRRGDLDAWLECKNEAEVRTHVLALAEQERERSAMKLQVTRSDVSLAAGELSAQEWRTCAAVLRWMQARIRRA